MSEHTKAKILIAAVWAVAVVVWGLFFFLCSRIPAAPCRHVDRIGDRLRSEAVQPVELIPPPSEEIVGEFIIDDKTEVTLDGKAIAFENVPQDGSVEVVKIEVDTETRKVIRIHFRTAKKDAKP